MFTLHKSPSRFCFCCLECISTMLYRIGYNPSPWLQLRAHLTRDFTKEGWLSKTGPRAGDAFRRRWVSLDKRKLMYYEDPLVSTTLLVICHYPGKNHGIVAKLHHQICMQAENDRERYNEFYCYKLLSYLIDLSRHQSLKSKSPIPVTKTTS